MPRGAGEGAAPLKRSDGDEPEQMPDPKKFPPVSTATADTAVDGGTSVKTAWVVGENPRILYLAHVKPLTRYVVQVDEKLPSAAGSSLGTQARYSVRTAAITASYDFTSTGMVLPARQNSGLPVVTVNVPEVDI
jgi:hypothetical protein